MTGGLAAIDAHLLMRRISEVLKMFKGKSFVRSQNPKNELPKAVKTLFVCF